MGFPILVRCHLYIESGPWYFTATFLQYSQQVGEGQLIVYYEHIGEKQPWKFKSFLYNRWHSIGCIVESCYTGTIPVIGSTNVTPSFIGKAHTQNDPWYDAFNFLQNIHNSKGCCKEDATPLLMHWSCLSCTNPSNWYLTACYWWWDYQFHILQLPVLYTISWQWLNTRL